MAIGCAVAIQQGSSFEEYAKRCVAIAGMRIGLQVRVAALVVPEDSPMAIELKTARLELLLAEAMTESTAQQAADAEYLQAHSEWESKQRSKAVWRTRYEATLAKFEAWEPLEADHIEFKAERIKELEQSILMDCRPDPAPKRISATEWRIQQITHRKIMVDLLESKAAKFQFAQKLLRSLGIGSPAGEPA